MKRENSFQYHSSNQANKVLLVERNQEPNGIALVNANRVAKCTSTDLMELDDDRSLANRFLDANVNSKLDILGKQVRYLQNTMADVLKEAKLTKKLNEAHCNFVKRPGNIYHLYQRSTGLNYFSLLSPEEWGGNLPHKYLGSFYLCADLSWKPAEQETMNEGTAFILELMGGPVKDLLNV